MSLDWANSDKLRCCPPKSLTGWTGGGGWFVCLISQRSAASVSQVLEITNIRDHTQLKILNFDDVSKNPFCHGFSLIHYLISMLQMKKTRTMEKLKLSESTQLANDRTRIDI